METFRDLLKNISRFSFMFLVYNRYFNLPSVFSKLSLEYLFIRTTIIYCFRHCFFFCFFFWYTLYVTVTSVAIELYKI